MEKFTFASSASLTHPREVVESNGYLTLRPGSDINSLGAPRDVLRGALPGLLLSSSTLLEVRDATQRRWVLLERDQGAPTHAGRWQFPAGRLSPGETPLECAIRELHEEVRLTESGRPLGWSDLVLHRDGEEFRWRFQDGSEVQLYAKHVFCEQTIEFYFHAVLSVENVSLVQAWDNEPYGRRVELLSDAQIEHLLHKDLLCPASALQWVEFSQTMLDAHRPCDPEIDILPAPTDGMTPRAS